MNWKSLFEDRLNRLIIILAVISICMIIANNMTLNYYITTPGVALALDRVVTVENGAKDAEGSFYLTSVSSQQANLFSFLLVTFVHPKGLDLSPKEETIPEEMDVEQYFELMEEMMTESQIYAKVVGLQEMGYEIKFAGEGAEIIEVMDQSHAKDILQPGDVIIAINGQKVELVPDVVSEVQSYSVGEVVKVTVKRDEEILDYNIELISSSEEEEVATIGIYILTYHQELEFPLNVDIKTENIAGPSAGAMFTLEIINQLHPEDLTRGYKIAGTGTIDFDGTVGPIGGVSQKVIAAERMGAEYFLSPSENYAEALLTATKLQVIKIDNISEALEFLLGLEENQENSKSS